MLHIHALGWDGICGMSPVALHRTTIGMTLAAEEFGAGFYRNGTKLAGVLQHPQKLSPEASARLRDNFGSIHSGPANTSKVAVLEEGMTFKEVMMPLEDAQYIESRKFQVTDIARIYRVPPHMMVADLEKATFSNIEQQGIEFVVHTMMPWVRRWERKCAGNASATGASASCTRDSTLPGCCAATSKPVRGVQHRPKRRLAERERHPAAGEHEPGEERGHLPRTAEHENRPDRLTRHPRRRNPKMEIERRIHTGTGIEVRRANADSGVTTLRGYAAKFDTLSEPLFGFREKIAPDAFADVLENDVRALFNHDPNHVLGRSAAGTLRVQQDEVGLLYEVDLPDTQAARDLVTSIKRGDVSQSSFAFTVEKDDWRRTTRVA